MVAQPNSGRVSEKSGNIPRGNNLELLARRFAITLRSWTSGEMLWSRASLRPGEVSAKPAVITNLASDVLTTGSYELLLTTGTPPTDIAVYEVSIIPPSAPR